MSIAGEIESLERGQERHHPVDGLDDVGPGLAPDDEHDGALAVDPAGDAVVLHVVDDGGHVAEAHAPRRPGTRR